MLWRAVFGYHIQHNDATENALLYGEYYHTMYGNIIFDGAHILFAIRQRWKGTCAKNKNPYFIRHISTSPDIYSIRSPNSFIMLSPLKVPIYCVLSVFCVSGLKYGTYHVFVVIFNHSTFIIVTEVKVKQL